MTTFFAWDDPDEDQLQVVKSRDNPDYHVISIDFGGPYPTTFNATDGCLIALRDYLISLELKP